MLDENALKELTQGERYDLLGKLLRLHVGAVKLDGDEDSWCLALRSENPVPPRCTMCVSGYPGMLFQPRKLVIDEPIIQIVEREEIYRDATVVSGYWPFQQTTRETVLDRVIEHKRDVVQSRGIWLVGTVLVGQKLQFPFSTSIHGDEFGPQGELYFKDKCDPSLYISIVVENTSDRPAQFIGLVLGKNADEQLKKRPRAV